MMGQALDETLARVIYGILVDHAGASDHPDAVNAFIYLQTHSYCPEYRFQGKLGFGGKYYRDSMNDTGRVGCYKEDDTPARLEMIRQTNDALKGLIRE